MGGRDVVDGLEVDGEVVEEGEERAGEEKDVAAIYHDGAVADKRALQQGAVSHVVLIYAKSNEQKHKADECPDYGGVAPRAGGATPL